LVETQARGQVPAPAALVPPNVNAPASGSVRRPQVMRNPTIAWAGDPATVPRISVVTPCYNHARYLEATLVSVLGQGYPNLEYVVMDGGSVDESADVVARYADFLARWESRRDDGPYDAVQRGFAHTTGELMLWLNADDMLHRNALWTLAAIFRDLPQVEWVMGLPTGLDPLGRTYLVQSKLRWSRYRYLRGDIGTIQQESVAWRRGLWERAGGRFDLRHRLAGDLELWMRFFRHARLYTAQTLVGGFRRVAGQLSDRCRAEYQREANEIVAREPRSAADRAALARLWRFERSWLRVPLLRRSWRVRQAYDRLFEFPPFVVYDAAAGRFTLSEVPPA
jgi:glycosyltransferase involved in cell wall biosynthesis